MTVAPVVGTVPRAPDEGHDGPMGAVRHGALERRDVDRRVHERGRRPTADGGQEGDDVVIGELVVPCRIYAVPRSAYVSTVGRPAPG